MIHEERLSSLRAPELFLPELDWNPKEDDLWFQSDRVDRVFAHLVGFDGVDSQLVKVSAGKLQVVDTTVGNLELALCGVGDKGLDDILTEALALKLALCGAGDKGLDDVFGAFATLTTSLVGATDKGLDDVLTELASVDDRLVQGGVNATTFLNSIASFLDVSPPVGTANYNLAAIKLAVESIDAILTDCYDLTGHYLKVHETA